MEYTPQISTGYYPEDAGWANGQDHENILLLCIPELSHLLTFQVKSYDYAWLYNQELDAYIFCFRLNNKLEQGIIFQKDHAGILLRDELALKSFTIAITDKELETLNEREPVFMLGDILWTRSEIANW